jgi:hypothetical protein
VQFGHAHCAVDVVAHCAGGVEHDHYGPVDRGGRGRHVARKFDAHAVAALAKLPNMNALRSTSAVHGHVDEDGSMDYHGIGHLTSRARRA